MSQDQPFLHVFVEAIYCNVIFSNPLYLPFQVLALFDFGDFVILSAHPFHLELVQFRVVTVWSWRVLVSTRIFVFHFLLAPVDHFVRTTLVWRLRMCALFVLWRIMLKSLDLLDL